ncbi:MAG: hypothetical protein K2M76_04005, partial [Muribaculaceae bacterium]|nr:hypothetical protein [Muribaculaceae bacterium]
VLGSVCLICLLAMGLDAVWLCNMLNRFTSWLFVGSDRVAEIPAGTVHNVYISPVWLWCYILVIILIVMGWQSRHKAVACVGAVALITITGCMYVMFDKDYPDYEMYVTRESSCTNVLVKCQDTLLLRTTAVSQSARMDELQRCQDKYKDYIGKRGIRAVILANDSCRLADCNVESKGRLVRFRDKTMILVQTDADVRPYGRRPDYVIVCRGYKGRIEDVWRIIGPDSLLLSADLNLRRHDRYMNELKQIDDVRFRSLREAGLYLR